jgi:hypothetical protein
MIITWFVFQSKIGREYYEERIEVSFLLTNRLSSIVANNKRIDSFYGIAGLRMLIEHRSNWAGKTALKLEGLVRILGKMIALSLMS